MGEHEHGDKGATDWTQNREEMRSNVPDLNLIYEQQIPRPSGPQEQTNQVRNVLDRATIEDWQNKVFSAQKEENLDTLVSLDGATLCARPKAYHEDYKHLVQFMNEFMKLLAKGEPS